jgi:prepilin-type N-terminal cleavage/methylation domain-containing protein
MIYAHKDKQLRFTNVGMRKRSAKGFTIVELLIVIVVIAILAAITLVAFNGISSRAKASAAQQAATQVSRKILAYSVDNADMYPAATGITGTDELSTLGITASGPTTFQYSSNNSATPRTFCITATNGDKSYYQSNSVTSPTEGVCPGHGRSGVPPVTNLFTNPGALSATSFNSFAGSGASRTGPLSVSAPWAVSGRAVRATWTTPPTNPNDGDIGISVAPFISPDRTYTLIYSLNINRDASVTAPRVYASAGSYLRQASSTTTVDPFLANQPRVQWITFTADSTAIGASLRVIQGTRGKVAGDFMELSNIILVEGATPVGFASGDTRDWVWNGPAGESTSTGPPTGL